jgi:3,4-dihydroxy-2-butanone 4-phosphate synthase
MCEMLGNGKRGGGKALVKKDVLAYAKKNGLDFVEGKEIFHFSSLRERI